MKPPPWDDGGAVPPGGGLAAELAALQVAVDRALERVPAEQLDACDICVLDTTVAACGCDCVAPRVVEKRDSCMQTSPMFEIVGTIPHIDSDEEEELVQSKPDGRHKSSGPVSTGTMTRKSRELVQPKSIGELPRRSLQAGVHLPGTRDTQGGAVILVDGPATLTAALRTHDIARLLLFYATLLERGEEAAGATVLLIPPSLSAYPSFLNTLDEAFCLVGKTLNIRIVLVWSPNDSLHTALCKSNIPCQLVGDAPSLRKHLSSEQAPVAVGGHATHDQEEWVEFFKECEGLTALCQGSGRLLAGLTVGLESCTGAREQQRILEKALSDADLVRLRSEGAQMVARVQDYAHRLSFSCHVRSHAEKARFLFGEIDRAARRLEELQETRRQRLAQLLRMRALEDEFNQVLTWLTRKGEEVLKKHSEIATSWQGIKTQEEEFEKFYFVAMRHIDKGTDLCEAAATASSDKVTRSGLQDLGRNLKSRLVAFGEQLEQTRERIEDTARAFCLVDKAYEWALETGKFVNRVKSDEGCNDVATSQIQQRLSSQPPLPDSHFAEINSLARKLESERIAEQAKSAQERHREVVEAVQTAIGGAPLMSRRRSLPTLPSQECGCACPRLSNIRENAEDSDEEWAGKRHLRRTSTWQYPAEGFDDGPDSDLQSKSSSEESDPPPPIPSFNSHLYAISRGSDLSLDLQGVEPPADPKAHKTLLLIMREMIQTERDYVASLEYVIEHYMPELLREDIPQALRGQRNVIFGNIEKIYEFHSQHFLQELQRCERRPLAVGEFFLRHENKFYLYALYNKNKPKSDSLMSEYGSAFFRSKQLKLGDKMDLGSYLLKPVQRMGKYALLLQQLMKAAGHEHGDLVAAEAMVRFQLRHGNDLLAMDSLRDCDVNLKEQGRLVRQNEFLVWQGRGKKCLRQVFLFEELIVFSKARRFPDRKNLDLYIYKHSMKTTDIGITAKVGDSSTKFEIWYRKRKPNDTWTLQSMSEEVKTVWTEELSSILWKQALKNREMRLQEMSSMGIGNKPCLDIRPSKDQISDRSISKRQLPSGTMPRLRNSIASLTADFRTIRRPQSTISMSSSSSSGSWGCRTPDRPRLSHSHSSTESGIVADMSGGSSELGRWNLEGQSPEKRQLERSNSSVTSDSLESSLSPPSSADDSAGQSQDIE